MSSHYPELIIFATHHKCGTYLIKDISKIFSKILKKRHSICLQDKLDESKTDVWFINNAKINFKELKKNYLCIHVYRHPLQVVLSGYKYHKVCDENWCNNKRKFSIKSKTYRQYLNILNKDDGIKFEIDNCSKKAITEMYDWNYDNPKTLNIKFEDIMEDFNKEFSNAFDFLNIDEKTKDKLLKGISKCNINNKKQNYLDKNIHVTNKTKIWDSYKYEITEEHLKHFKKIHKNNLMEKLGYIIQPLIKPVRLKTNYKWKYVKLINNLFTQGKISEIQKKYYIKNYKSFICN